MSDHSEQSEILSFAETLAGDDADETVLRAMCAAAAAELEGRLKSGVSREELGELFVTAAGVLALSMYCAVKDPESIRSFRAGDVSAEYGSTVNAEGLRSAAEQMLSAYLADRGFGFLGVRG